jgi:hypothetical protein
MMRAKPDLGTRAFSCEKVEVHVFLVLRHCERGTFRGAQHQAACCQAHQAFEHIGFARENPAQFFLSVSRTGERCNRFPKPFLRCGPEQE